MKHGLIYVYGDITRRDDDNRIVEGYCFVNESVGKGQATIARAAMEAATKAYMDWGCVREMHGANAVGTANDGATPQLGVTWDDTGAFFRCKVVDDAAWEKTKQGVFKGFSVGVKPLVMRGNTVQKCDWVEVSLVDRPRDPDTRLSIARSESYNGETEFEVESEEDPVVRGAFKDGIADMEKSALRNAAWYRLEGVLWSIQNGDSNDKPTLVRQACSEFAEYIAPIIGRGELGTNELLLRLESLEAPVQLESIEVRADAAFVTRAETAEAEVTRLLTAFEGRGELIQRLATCMPAVEDEAEESMVARAVEMLNAPVVEQPPLRVTVTAEGLVKRMTDGSSADDVTRLEAIDAELTEVLRTDWTKKSEAERNAALTRVEALKHEKAALRS